MHIYRYNHGVKQRMNEQSSGYCIIFSKAYLPKRQRLYTCKQTPPFRLSSCRNTPLETQTPSLAHEHEKRWRSKPWRWTDILYVIFSNLLPKALPSTLTHLCERPDATGNMQHTPDHDGAQRSLHLLPAGPLLQHCIEFYS